MGTYQKNGVTYQGYSVTIGSASAGVVINNSTTPPTTSPSWFINAAGTVGLTQEIFRYATQVSQRYAFKVQDNPMGPFTYNIKLVDSAATPIQQQGNILVQVWDSALQRNKKTILIIDAASAAASGTGGNLQQRLPYNFGDPGALYVTAPGDIVRIFFTPNQALSGVNSTNSVITLYVDQLVEQ